MCCFLKLLHTLMVLKSKHVYFINNDISVTVNKNKNIQAVTFSMPVKTTPIFATHYLLLRSYIVNEEYQNMLRILFRCPLLTCGSKPPS